MSDESDEETRLLYAEIEGMIKARLRREHEARLEELQHEHEAKFAAAAAALAEVLAGSRSRALRTPTWV